MNVGPQPEGLPSRESLIKKNVTELKQILRAKSAKIPKTKQGMIDSILSLNSIHPDQVKLAADVLKAGQNTNSAPHHSHNRMSFNTVDLHDRFWNRRQDHLAVRNWRAKFVLSKLQCVLINAWVLYAQHDKIGFEEYGQTLAEKLMIYCSDPDSA